MQIPVVLKVGDGVFELLQLAFLTGHEDIDVSSSSGRPAINTGWCRPKDVLFHSDQSCQYTSHKFRNELIQHGAAPKHES
jgi:transposase InsO family protein